MHPQDVEVSLGRPERYLQFQSLAFDILPPPPCDDHQVLANYLVRQGIHSLHDKHVLELGSGTGLVGLVAAMLGAVVGITDQAFVGWVSSFTPPRSSLELSFHPIF